MRIFWNKNKKQNVHVLISSASIIIITEYRKNKILIKWQFHIPPQHLFSIFFAFMSHYKDFIFSFFIIIMANVFSLSIIQVDHICLFKKILQKIFELHNSLLVYQSANQAAGSVIQNTPDRVAETTEIYLLTVLESRKSKIKLLVSPEDSPCFTVDFLLAMSSCGIFSVYTHFLGLFLFLFKKPVLLDYQPTLMNSFDLNFLLKVLCSNIVTLKVKLQCMNLGAQNSVHSN